MSTKQPPPKGARTVTARRRTPGEEPKTGRPPAATPDARERQLIALAVDRVEERIRKGTATSQELVHYLKLGSSRERLEQERLAHENKLTEAKIEAIQSAQRIEEMYGEALAAMRGYAGIETPKNDDYDEPQDL